MSDFAQMGLITTLQRLNEHHLSALEQSLIAARRASHLALVLPCHASEVERPALARLVEELCGAAWLGEVVVSMNGSVASAREVVEVLFSTLPVPVRVLWNEGAAGKGENVAAALRLLSEEGRATAVATQDCDVVSFRRQDLARLFYAVSVLGFRFAKAYYSRVTDRLYGRVTRLFLGPLLQAWVSVAGHQPLLDFLLSFRYALSGEVAMTGELAASLAVAPGWGLEIAMLCDVFRHVDPREVCQVDGGTGYDHKHQPATTALAAMAEQIAAELARQLEAEGMPNDAAFHRALRAAYEREASHALRRSAALAAINALPFDEAGERQIVAAFAGALLRE